MRLPFHVLADAEGWALEKWLVKPGDSVYVKQRIAVLKSVSSGATDHVIAPHTGTFLKPHVREGNVVDSSDVRLADIEFCPHSVVFNGVCALCGEEEEAHFSKAPQEQSRLPVAYSASLSVSQTEAESVSSVVARRLFENKQLSLVLDLDHTLVHATDDPQTATILQHSPENVDLSSVTSFSLPSSRPGPRNADTMHIKLRPNLAEFLERVAVKFNLHIYTMGSRAYADRVARLIDPDNRFFGGRITSREDFPEGKCNQKNIERLFPCDDSMALIVDDREDVWISNAGQSYMPNLIRAYPYHFWVGMHEAYERVSSSKDSDEVSRKPRPPRPPTPVVEVNGNGGPLKPPRAETDPKHEVISNGASKTNSESQSRVNEEHQNIQAAPSVRTLTQAREIGCVSLSTEKQGAAKTIGHENKPDKTKEKQHVDNTSSRENQTGGKRNESALLSVKLRRIVKGWWDADALPKSKNHLLRLAQVLEDCHTEFFRQCKITASQPGLEEKPTGNTFQAPVDVKDVLAGLRKRVLAECVLTFSGMKQKGEAPETVPAWNLALRLGATCSMDFVNGRTTHVVSSIDRPPNTQKCIEAMQFGTAFVVTANWVEDSALNFERQNEFAYCDNAKKRFTNGEEFRTFVEIRYKEAARALRKRSRPELDEISNKEVKGVTPPNKRRQVVAPVKSLKSTESDNNDSAVRVLSHDEIGAAMDAMFDD